jgi:Cytochrome C oxidase, cbb3-type, subunit III
MRSMGATMRRISRKGAKAQRKTKERLVSLSSIAPLRPCVRFLIIVPCLVGCRQQMAEQPNYHRPLEQSAFFADGRAARPLEPDTVPRGHLRTDPAFDTGKQGDDYVDSFPFEIDEKILRRGRQRFDIFCAVCHDRVGTGNGAVIQRGFTRPPNLHTDLSRGFRLRGRDLPLREAPVGYFYDVITNGYGAMPDYRAQIPPSDRWAIAAHVRVLQLSQHFRKADLPEAEQAEHFRAEGAP